MYENEESVNPIDDKRYYCSLCLEEQKQLGSFHISRVSNFSTVTSTGNINKHLLDRHDVVVDSTQTKIPLILNYLNKHREKTGDDQVTQHEFNRDLVVWFVRDLIAFENVAKQGMIDFMSKNLPSLQLPTPETLAGTALNDMFVAVSARIKEELSTVCSICVMADGWTDRYHGRSYVGIRVSCVKDWQYRLYTLSCRALPGSHTGQYLADHIRSILSRSEEDANSSMPRRCC